MIYNHSLEVQKMEGQFAGKSQTIETVQKKQEQET